MLLEISALRVELGPEARPLRLLRDVSLTVARGSIHGVIGESGCGKTITGMTCLGLIPTDSRITADRFHFDGQDLRVAAASLRGQRICMISQDPAAALNPVLRISTQLDHVLRAHSSENKAARHATARALLAETGLPDPDRVLKSFPHELSGGMQQRVVIAQALATGAEFMIADEPTTALDRTTGRQVLEVLRKLVASRGLTVLMISHDMGVIGDICDTISVLYSGTLVEAGPSATLLQTPRHPYTRALLAALPSRAQKGAKLPSIDGHPPTAATEVSGCIFADRCAQATEICRTTKPPEYSDARQIWRCHHEVPHG